MNPTAFFSCDWGTTSFRLRWIEPGFTVAREVVSDTGCKLLHDQALASGEDRAKRFERHIMDVLAEWQRFVSRPLPLVISGMASSTIGWREVPYLEGPLNLDATNLRFHEIEWPQPECVSRTFLIGGVAIHPEMMRGEEVEAIGLLAGLPPRNAVLLLPGTHSKHLNVHGQRVTAIRTCMTGELFDLLSRHSILRNSVFLGDAPRDRAAFDEGVRWVAQHGLLQSLFRVRTRAVLDRLPASANSCFLSGLLIGAELCGLPSTVHLLLAGAGKFAELYAQAFEALNIPSERWTALPPERVQAAVPRGQALFLQEHP